MKKQIMQANKNRGTLQIHGGSTLQIMHTHNFYLIMFL